MSFDVRITRPALEDAHDIYSWIESEGAPLNAARWYRELFESIGTLTELAERCPAAPESDALGGGAIRHLVRGDDRVLYVVRAGRVAVLHIRHGSRRPATREQLQRAIDEAESL